MDNYPNNDRNQSEQSNEVDSQNDTSRSEKHRKKSWYNLGWVWMIFAAIGIIVLFIGLSGLTEETASINQSIQQQTEVLEEEKQALHSIKEGINTIAETIKEGFNNIVVAIKDAVTDIMHFI